jgi:hypothetical protein
MSYVIKKLYSKYFQKSRSFLFPILGLKKNAKFIPIQCYMAWENVYSTEDRKLILIYEKENTVEWKNYIARTVMSNQLFECYIETEVEDEVALVFDLHCIEKDYVNVLEGKYSKLDKLSKKRIREYYGYASAEYAYIESFLYPDKYVKTYSQLLDVEEEHIRFTGELCDLPNLNLETLKIKPYAKVNDVDKINMESRENI